MAALATTEHSDKVRDALRGLIWNKSLSIRNEGYVLLGQVGAPWSVSVLLEGLDKEFGEERVEPIVGLGRAGDPSVAEKIHPGPFPRRPASGRFGQPRAPTTTRPRSTSASAMAYCWPRRKPLVPSTGSRTQWRPSDPPG